MKIKTLVFEKASSTFMAKTRTKQATGLSVCLDMICISVGEALRIVVSNMAHIDLAVSKYQPKNIVLGCAIFSSAEMLHIRKKYPHAKVYMLVHSPASFMSIDSFIVKRIHEALRVGVIPVINDPRTQPLLKGSIYLENCYALKDIKRIEPELKDEIRIICPGGVRPFKNQLMQALVAIKYADSLGLKLKFYMNNGRVEGGESVILNIRAAFAANPKHELLPIPWLEHREFVRSLSNYHMGMQVSLSESYNTVAADFVNAGLPMVVSNEIRFVSEGIKANPNDAEDILSKMKTCHNYTEENLDIFKKHNDKAIDGWKRRLA